VSSIPFLLLVSGGVAGAGGPAAGTTVFRLLKDDCRCLGSITGGKFCLKMCDGEQACNVPTHAPRKAKLQVDHYYIRENDTKAYCDPKLNMTLLTESQASQLRDLQLTKEQLIEFFKSVESGDSSNWFPDVIESSSTHETGKASPWVELMSPKAAEQKTGIFGFFSALSYEDDNASDSESSVTSGMTPHRQTMSEMMTTLKDFKHRFKRIKAKWSSAFQDIEVGHLMVTTDIERLGTLVQAQLGRNTSVEGTSHTNVWEALAHAASSMQQGMESVHQSVRTLANKLDDVITNHVIWQTDIESQVASVKDTTNRHESRFSKIFPFLMNLRSSSCVAQPTMDLSTLQVQISNLAATISTLQDSQWNSNLNPSTLMRSHDVSSIEESLRDVQAQITLLQVRIVGNGVQVEGFVFRRYGLFVDGVSLLDFFSFVSHVDTEKAVSAYYNQQKSGFTSMYEARVAASTQNLFPMVFGRSNSGGLDDSEFLPALQDPDKWDNGLTGLKYQISQGMSDIEFQLESSIDTILKDYPESRQIAKDCLYKSKRFVTDLCNFISQDYQKWQHRGHGKKDSWRKTNMCASEESSKGFIPNEWSREIFWMSTMPISRGLNFFGQLGKLMIQWRSTFATSSTSILLSLLCWPDTWRTTM